MTWSVTDQALSSVTNFAVFVLVARAAEPDQLGVFAIFMAFVIGLLQICECLVGNPLLVRFSARSTAPQGYAAAQAATGCALGLGVGSALLLGTASLMLPGSGRTLLWIGALCVPGLMVQDTMRFFFFSARRPKLACINDALWLVVQLTTSLLIERMSIGSMEVVTLVWGLTGAACGALALVQARVVPRPLEAYSWWKSHIDISGFLTLEYLAGQAITQIYLLCIGAAAGLRAVAAVSATRTLYGPLNVVTNATRMTMIPYLVEAQPKSFRQCVRAVAGGLAFLAIVWGLIASLVPAWIGGAVLGRTWSLATPLILIMAIERAAYHGAEVCGIGLLALRRVKQNFVARLLVGAAGLAASTAGAGLAGSSGAVRSGAAVWIGGLVVWSLLLERAIRQLHHAAGTGQRPVGVPRI